MRVSVTFDPEDSCAVTGADRYDLRRDPKAILNIEPAQNYAALGAFLAHLNIAESPFLTFGCKVWPAVESGAAEPHIFASRVDLVFLRQSDNFGQGPLTDVAHRLADLLQRESNALWADLRITTAKFSAEQSGYCLRFTLHARGATPEQAEVRWGLGLAHAQQALLFVARALRQQGQES